MMMKIPVFTIYLSVLFALGGLTVISTAYLPDEEVKNKVIQHNNSLTFNTSDNFNRYEFILLNSENTYGIEDSLNHLDNRFEQVYLKSLSEKRKGEYNKSFGYLFSLLNSYPAYYPFYDELIFSAKASDNLSKIEKIVISEPSNTKYSDYLYALFYYHTNQYSKAEEILQSRDDFEPVYLLSYAYRGLGDYENALTVMRKAEGLLEKGSNRLSKVLISQGSLFLLSGNYDESDKLYRKGLKSSRLSGDRREEIKALINLAILDDQNGNVDEAQAKLYSALQISRNIRNQELEATALSELAVSFTYSGDVVEAKNHYEESFKLFKKLNHKERLANLCANIANLYSYTANYSAAISYYNDGLVYAGDNVFSRILNLRGLGDIYSNLSNYSKALGYYEEAKELSSKIKDAASGSLLDISIGTLYYNFNKPGKALQVFSDVIRNINSEADPYTTEDILFKIGLAYSAVDSLSKSNDALLKAFKIAEGLNDTYYKTIIITELGHNYLLQNELLKAEKLISDAMQLSKANDFNQLFGLQNLYSGKIAAAKNDIAGAVKYFKVSSALALREMDYTNAIESEYLHANTLMQKQMYSEAEKHYLKAVEYSDRISESLVNNAEIHISHFSGLNNIYNELAELYLRQSRYEEAFLLIEKSHSRNTFRNLIDLKVNSIYDEKEKLKRYYDLKWMINSNIYVGSRLKELTSEFNNLREDIYASDPELKSMLAEDKHLSLKDIQNSLSDKENLITLFFGESKLYFIRLTKDKIDILHTAVSKEEVKELLENISPLYSSNYRNGELYLNQDLFSFNAKGAYSFYEKVIQPAIIGIPAGEMIIFSMPAELAFVPVEFLVTEFEEGDSPFYYDNKRYLIEDYSISYSPSASIFILQKMKTQENGSRVLLVGDPEINNKDFALSYRGGLLEDESFASRNLVLYPLKYSKEEIENLNSLLPNGMVLLSADATEKNFKDNASQSSIIHLSTHSFLLKDQPLIIFSQNNDQDEDGYLEPGEIVQLRLNTDLVVLSSCRSGLGMVDKAEGVIGMQKSFFEAGAKSIIVSLWDVNDKYTSLFMQSFYQYLSEGYDKSESLKKAKLFFKENHSANPYYWSAFVLSGDVSKIVNIKTVTPGYLLYILPGLLFLIIGVSFCYRKYFKKNSI
jgi:CHAT domain-containing protein/Flp pilus assembly protein TadD